MRGAAERKPPPLPRLQWCARLPAARRWRLLAAAAVQRIPRPI